MFGMGGGEITVILLVALLVFGPKHIPELARGIKRVYQEFTRIRNQVDDTVSEIREEIDLRIDELDEKKPRHERPHSNAPGVEPAEGSVANHARPVVLPVAEPDDYLADGGEGRNG